jgi:Fe-S oxidoreductase
MWMEEKLGTRINLDRSQELLDTTAAVVAVGCPFCRVMITDGVNAINASSDSPAEVLDVAQLLLRSIKLA